MLAVESLTEAVSFLPLYDLDSLLLANRQLSNIASKCVKGIPVWEFERVGISACENSTLGIIISGDEEYTVHGWLNIADVLAIALHNACFKCLVLGVRPDGVLPLPEKSALNVEELALCAHEGASADLLADVIARFRKVQAINLHRCEHITDFSPVIELCRLKGIRRVVNKSSGVNLMAKK